MELKPKLVICGSSHATRLYQACQRNANLKEKYSIIGNTRPGATWYNFKLDKGLLEQLGANDVVIIQFLGNDLIKPEIKRTFNPKIIHLLQFIPRSDAYVKTVREHLKKFLTNVKAKIYFIDDPYRHLSCCPAHAHSHPELLKYLVKRNRELKEIFSEYTVFDHRRLIKSMSFGKISHMSYYRKIMDDDVHMKENFYDEWAESLSTRI